ncbi:MAG: YraN family protein [Ilumatobacteraceae bacterium]
MASARQARGAYGERRAANWYLAHGYEVLDRNWRHGRSGELDLVVARPGELVFCEVKARASAEYGVAEAVTPTKQARIRRLAMAWLEAHPSQRRHTLRFDVACVTGTDLEVIESAF